MEKAVEEIHPEEALQTIVATNISADATEDHIREFFGFCGPVNRILRGTDEESNEGTQFAIVVFDERQAANTALLLTNALVLDRPIQVTAFEAPETVDTTTSETEESAPETSSSSSRGATAVVASVVAAGYVKSSDVASDMKKRAMELDSKVGMTEKAQFAYNVASMKAKQVDEHFHITERLKSAKAAASHAAKKVDSDLGISEKAKYVQEKGKELAGKAMENPYVKTGVGLVQSAADATIGAVRGVFQQTRDEIQAKQAEKDGVREKTD